LYRIGPDCRNSLTGGLRRCQLVRRLRKPGKEGTMTARPEAAALLTDVDVGRAGALQRFVHPDGRPVTAEQTELASRTTDDHLRAAASQLAAAPQRRNELVAPCVRAVGGDSADRRPPAEAR
jgi:hypothetical protein